jgi:hypothetical protein
LTYFPIYGNIILDKNKGGKIMQKMIKACNFYVSEWHLFAALLPYIREELKNKNKIMVISQDKLEKGMKHLVKKLNLRFENEKGLDDIKWLSDEFVLEISEETKPVTIVVQGTLEFINEINAYIEEKLAPLYDNLKIINCYEVYNTNTMLYNILDEHDYVFNTAGMNEKSEIFPGYIDKKKTLHEAASSIHITN